MVYLTNKYEYTLQPRANQTERLPFFTVNSGFS